MRNEYWEEYYSKSTEELPNQPSQFAIDVLPEINMRGIKTVFEFGCGNGRDTLFFSKIGKAVYAFDQSNASIKQTNNLISIYPESCAQILNATEPFSLPEIKNKPIAIYCRFFLHTLTYEEIKKFAKNCMKNTEKNDILLFEYRTLEDENRKKSTNNHFRNYLRESTIQEIFKNNQFRKIYEKRVLD